MSQVRKYDGGGTTQTPAQTPLTNPNPNINLKINGQAASMDPQKLNSEGWGYVQSQLQSAGHNDPNELQHFQKVYQQFVDQAKSGTYNINTNNGKYVNSTYAGAPGANLGLNPDGSVAQKSGIGNVVSGHSFSDTQAMAKLNPLIGNYIAQAHSDDLATAKTKSDADAAKALQDKNTASADYMANVNRMRDPATNLYGIVGGQNTKYTYDDYWSGKTGQGTIAKGGFERIGSTLFDKGLDDPDNQKAFKSKWGLSVNDARAAMTKAGYNNGQLPSDITMEGLQGLSRDLQVGPEWNSYLNRNSALTPEQQAQQKGIDDQKAKLTNDATNLKHNQELQQQGYKFTNKGITYSDADLKNLFTGKMEDGTEYQNGAPINGILPPDPKVDSAFESKSGDLSNSPYALNGKRVSYQEFWNAHRNDSPQDLAGLQAQEHKMVQSRNDRVSGLKDLSEPDEDGNRLDDSNTANDFIFRKEIAAGQHVKAAAVTGSYPDLINKGERLAAYLVPGKTNINTDGLVRYRHMAANGKTTDGIIKTDVDGRDFLEDAKGNRIDLGNKSDNKITVTDPYRIPYNSGVYNTPNKTPKLSSEAKISIQKALDTQNYKKGGILKAQTGAKIDWDSNSGDKSFHSANAGKVFDGNSGNLSTADKTELGAIAGQLVSLGIGFIPAPGASVVSALGGVGSTIADETSNVMKRGWKWGDLVSVGGSLALDAATAIPGLGEAADMGKLAKMVKGSSKLIQGVFTGIGAAKALGSLYKVTSGQATIDDWQNIAGGIQAAIAGKRLADPYIATKSGGQTASVKVAGKPYDLSASELSTIQSAKPTEQLDLLKGIIKTKDPNADLTKINTSILNDTRSFINKKSFGLLGDKGTNVNVPKIDLNSNGRQLIDYDNANWYQKKFAIPNTIAQNPNITGADKYTIDGGRFWSGANPDEGPTKDGSGLNWIANSYRMKYASPVKPVTPTVEPVTPTITAPIENTGTGTQSFRFKQLPAPTSNDRQGTNFVIPYEDQENVLRPSNDKVNPLASSGQSQESISKLNEGKGEPTANDLLAMIKLQPKSKGSVTSASDNIIRDPNYKSASSTVGKKLTADKIINKIQLRPGEKGEVLDNHYVSPSMDDRQAITADNLIKLIKLQPKERGGITSASDGISPNKTLATPSLPQVKQSISKQDPYKSAFYKNYTQNTIEGNARNKDYEENTLGERLQTALQNKKETKGKGLKFKEGGRIPKFQNSGIVPFLSDDEIYGSGDDPNTLVGKALGIKPITNNTPSTLPIVQSQNANWNPPPIQNGDVPNNKTFWGSVGSSLSNLTPKNLDPSSVSELGRALYARQVNSQIDTRVERPMLNAPVEVPVSVHGNLSAITASNQGANDLMRNTGLQLTSDAGINAGALLNAGFKGEQLRQQGVMQSNDMLDKTRQMSYQQQSQAAQARNQIANQNVQTNARATQAEREALNQKMVSMNAPINDWWAKQDASNNQQFLQQRQLNTQIGQNAIQNQYNMAMRPMMMEMNSLQMENEGINNKMRYNPDSVTQPEKDRYEANNKRIQELITNSYPLQNKLQYGQLQVAKNYGNWRSSNLFDPSTPLPTQKAGGTLRLLASGGTASATILANSKVAVEQSKENAANVRQVKANSLATLKAQSEGEEKQELQASKSIQQLIMKALS